MHIILCQRVLEIIKEICQGVTRSETIITVVTVTLAANGVLGLGAGSFEKTYAELDTLQSADWLIAGITPSRE